MATKRKLQVRYGAAASRPTLATGEIGLDTDTGSEALYIGTPAGNKIVSSMGITKYIAKIVVTAGSIASTTILENTTGQTPTVVYATGGGADYITINLSYTAASVFVSATSATGGVLNIVSVGGSGAVSIYLRDFANGQISTGSTFVSVILYP